MADGKFDLKLIPEFNGWDCGLTNIKWFEKAELIYDLCDMKDIASVLQLWLMCGAFALFQQLSKDEIRYAGHISDALYIALPQSHS